MPASRLASSGCKRLQNWRRDRSRRGDARRVPASSQSPSARTRKPPRRIFHRLDIGLNHVGARPQGFDQLAESAFQRLQERTAGILGPRRGKNAARQAAVLGFDFDKARQHAVDAHLARIAAIDAREQRLSQIIDGLLAVMIQQKFVDRTIGLRAVGLAENLQAHADLGAPTQQPRLGQRQDLGGDHHHQSLGHRNQLALFDDVSDAGMVVRADHLIGQAKFADQIHRPRLGGHESVGAFFEHAALLHRSLDHSAHARPALQQRGTNARFREVVSGGKTGDSAADNQCLVLHATS